MGLEATEEDRAAEDRSRDEWQRPRKLDYRRLTAVYVGIAISNHGIPAEFSNPAVIPRLIASNPGIMRLKNCPLNDYKSPHKMTYRGIRNHMRCEM